MNIDYHDQVDLFDPSRWAWPVHLVGLGGIGSAVLYQLMKLGVSEIHLWDDDTVEPHNIPAQILYRPSDVGLLKVEAARNFLVRQEIEANVVVHPTRATPRTEFEGVVVAGVDSMASRMEIWQAVKDNALVPLYMGGRIGGEKVQLLSLDPCDDSQARLYEALLFPDAKAQPLPCGARTIIYPPQQVAVWVAANLVSCARDELSPILLVASLREMQYAARQPTTAPSE